MGIGFAQLSCTLDFHPIAIVLPFFFWFSVRVEGQEKHTHTQPQLTKKNQFDAIKQRVII